MESLKDYGERTAKWKRENTIRFPEYKPWAPYFMTEQDKKDIEDAVAQPTLLLKVLAFVSSLLYGSDVRHVVRHMKSSALQCAINTRRLPNLPMPKLEDALGNPDWLERVWSMFWLGPIA